MIWNGLRTKLTFNAHVFRESFLPAPSIFSFFRFPWAQAKGARGHSGMPKRSWEFHSASLLHKVCMFTDTVEILTRSVWNLSNLIIPPRSKSRCSYLRQNLYDHATEYWITVRETGSRTETHTEKEVRTQREKLVIISAPLPHSLPLNLKWRWQQNSPNYSGCLPTCFEASGSVEVAGASSLGGVRAMMDANAKQVKGVADKNQTGAQEQTQARGVGERLPAVCELLILCSLTYIWILRFFPLLSTKRSWRSLLNPCSPRLRKPER